ncbi:MAG: arginase family protein, partial [Chloroflexota bacterium]
EVGSGCLDYGDTPAYHGVLRRAQLAVGGTLLAARLVAGGEVEHAFNPGGGLHHAQPDRAGGFCVFNDVAIAVRYLQREFGLRRIAVVDFDGHHGDGTQRVFYEEPVLTVSLHRYDGRFYPRTGLAEDIGGGRGLGYNLNIPLPRGAGDAAYLLAVQKAVLPRLYAYRPELIFVQVGADGHHGDPLVHLGLSVGLYETLGRLVAMAAHDLCDGRLVLVAGGGYRPEAVARCWALFLASVAGVPNADTAKRLESWKNEDALPPPNAEAVAGVRETLSRLRGLGALAEPVSTGTR